MTAAILFLVCHVASAEDPNAEARRHFELGNAHFAAERYADALREFQAGYSIVPNPKFLLNMGQTFRKLGRLDAARSHLLRYMDTLEPHDPRRAEVARIVAEIDLELHAAPPPAPAVDLKVQPPDNGGGGRWRTTGLVLTIAGGVALAVGGTLVGIAVDDDRTISNPPPGWVYDPDVVRQRDTFYPVGLSLVGVGAALVTTGVIALVYSGRPQATSARVGRLGPELVLRF